MIDKAAPLCEVYSNVIASSPLMKPQPHGWISGCLYEHTGRIIPLSQRFGGFYGDFFPNADPATITTDDLPDLPVLKGKSVYLGHFMPHYGHFLLEMLSSFWIHRTFASFDFFVFHPFVFGEQFPSYIRDAFQAFGIPISKVRIIKERTRILDVTVPERLVRLNKSANLEVSRVYQFLADTYGRNASSPATHYYYISRVRMSLRSGQRAIINEPFIERMLSKMGFHTVYPELLSFQEQVSLFQRADIVCGLSGSALHNCVFMRSNALLIEIADLRSPNTTHPMQCICNQLSNINYHFIAFSGRILDRDKQVGLFALDQLVARIAAMLSQHQADHRLVPPTRKSLVSLRHFHVHALMITINIIRLFKSRLMRHRSYN